MNPITQFNQKYDDFITGIAGKMDNIDLVLLRTIKVNIEEIIMLGIVILSLFWVLTK
ncbi:MAG: hypothetical protein MPEBLZ_02051 [Candidatus Methanoperedens nitroreducens]|uniref:Uncharacterized protein n=1 Tax=Candidatus Methanoperedens nitratireducens TaxID=1392998 RepID=A0A0P7ZF63_9EURY|nr:MAG: hypothetical protein MPEBLZ_02051 [Candidatus Methanoperedens sp. BLZ1]